MRVRGVQRDSHRRPIGAVSVAGRGVLAGVFLFAALGSMSCGSKNSGTVAGSTTTNPASASTLIDPFTGHAADDPAVAACLVLADTVGLDGLVPIDSSSWRDERERILVDARRESTLLMLAVRGASPELAPALETLATHADRVVEELSEATSYTDAVDRLESTGEVTELRAAADAVSAWRDTNC